MDCIYEAINNTMPNMTIKDIFGCIGIANTLVSFKFADEWFDIVDGRGAGDPVKIMKLLDIPFS